MVRRQGVGAWESPMRGFVRAFSSLLAFLPAFLLPPTAFAQDRRLVVTEGADYFGADYDVRKDVDLDPARPPARATTSARPSPTTQSARWCFLKSGVGELRAVDGRRLRPHRRRLRRAAARRRGRSASASSASSSQSYIDEARHFVGRISDSASSDDRRRQRHRRGASARKRAATTSPRSTTTPTRCSSDPTTSSCGSPSPTRR